MDDNVNIAVVGIVGSGAGLTLGVFIGEVVTRLTGQTGLPRFGIKAVIKGLLFVACTLIAGKLSPLLSWGVNVAGYAIGGSIIPDAVELYMSGGIVAAAESVAVAIRMSSRKVTTTSGAGQNDSNRVREETAKVSQSVF